MITHEVVKVLGTLSEAGASTKRLTVTSWNGGPGKLDIRTWTQEGKPLKGCTLTDDEARKLMETLKEFFDGGNVERMNL